MTSIAKGFILLSVVWVAAVTWGDCTADWYTLDGGGGYSAGGAFEIEGTIGQPDAGAVMTGGGYSLVGGFWAGVPSVTLGDLNCDGLVTPFDIDPFILALTNPAAYHAA